MTYFITYTFGNLILSFNLTVENGKTSNLFLFNMSYSLNFPTKVLLITIIL